MSQTLESGGEQKAFSLPPHISEHQMETTISYHSNHGMDEPGGSLESTGNVCVPVCSKDSLSPPVLVSLDLLKEGSLPAVIMVI